MLSLLVLAVSVILRFRSLWTLVDLATKTGWIGLWKNKTYSFADCGCELAMSQLWEELAKKMGVGRMAI